MDKNILEAMAKGVEDKLGLSWANCLRAAQAAITAYEAAKPVGESQSELEKLNQELLRVIKFAVTIDDHFDMREFLDSWLHGDVSEWPEFNQIKGVI